VKWWVSVLMGVSVVLGMELRFSDAEDKPTPVEPKVYTQSAEVVAPPPAAAAKTEQIDVAWEAAPYPAWIWGDPEADKQVFRTTFRGGAAVAKLRATCDNAVTIFINGQQVLSHDNWQFVKEADVQKWLKDGENELIAEATDSGGPAALLVKLVLVSEQGDVRTVVSDASWQVAASRTATAWAAAKSVLEYGQQPYGAVLTKISQEQQPAPFVHLPGFQVERLFTVPKEECGSWVCLTVDPQGRLIASDQQDKGLYRITPSPVGSDEPTRVELLTKEISSAQGMLFAFDSLYVCVNGPQSGLYRLKDTNGDDQFDEVKLLHPLRGGGEHGPHALRLSPDGKSIVVVCGNHTLLPYDVQRNSDPQTMGGMRSSVLKATLPEQMTSRILPAWDEDLLLPRQWDAGGHAVGILAPGGWIAQTDPDGQHWELLSVGYRNQYDAAFNADGELFVYDADMEWDFGAPWYRPTRVVHATSGSEFGWRSGTGKWPSYFVDSLPPAIEIGPGSPVGVDFGYGAKFPAKYQKALFICDWTFGTMYALHFTPQGSSYTATKEEFVARAPLPLTDVTVGKDGSMYFTIGGRGTQSELFRVTYVGEESTAPVDARTVEGADLRALRRTIEVHHTAQPDAEHVPFLVKQLGHSDRFIRYAARVALERIPASKWQDRVLLSDDVNTIITGVVGLARVADASMQLPLLLTLGRLQGSQLSETQQLEALRAAQLVLIRLGPLADDDARDQMGQKLASSFPSPSEPVNRELATLLVAVQSPDAARLIVPLLNRASKSSASGFGDLLSRNAGYGSSVAAMLANQPDAEQIHFAFALRNLKTGWTPELRKAYFQWFEKARTWSGGNSYQKFLTNIDNDAFSNCSDAERLQIEATGARKPYIPPELPKPEGPGRVWTTDEVVALAGSQLSHRNFKQGQKAFAAARCIVCHRFAGDGGATGPDLTQAVGRFSIKDLTDAIVDPSKVVSDQYKASILETNDGQVVTGRIVSETSDAVTVVVNPEDATKTVTLKKSNIVEQTLSAASLMPKDLINGLNQNEMLDLLAYILSRGDKNHPMFAQ
jgi:putative heme-binding domain-containing protein